jgi:hypothetical protein
VWHTLGLAAIERIGTQSARSSRTAERLLHDLGEREAAYRVEAHRKRMGSRGRAGSSTSEESEKVDSLADMQIVIAGGHPGLRKAASRSLVRRGATAREIPSHYEAVRREREMQQIIAGSDLVIVIVRQIAHATSDLVKAASRKTDVPMVFAWTPSVAGIMRAVMESDFAF